MLETKISERYLLFFALGFSSLALISAFSAQYIFGLEPCILCLYQRVPFALVILIAALGMFLKRHETVFLFICGLVFLSGGGLGLYHTGVEQHWWASALEGCQIVWGQGDMLDQIMKAPAARCDEIPWSDPVFGLSMANYNAIISSALGLLFMLKTCFLGKINSLS